MKLWARTIFARTVKVTNILCIPLRPQKDAKHVKVSTTQLCKILQNKLAANCCFLNKQPQSADTKSDQQQTHLLVQQQNQNKSIENVNSKKRQHTHDMANCFLLSNNHNNKIFNVLIWFLLYRPKISVSIK